eukprot:2315550-Amphidinium_carterae.1
MPQELTKKRQFAAVVLSFWDLVGPSLDKFSEASIRYVENPVALLWKPRRSSASNLHQDSVLWRTETLNWRGC